MMTFKKNHILRLGFILMAVFALSACKTMQHYDYSALKASKPRSILVIPPLNESIEVNAPYTFLSTISMPLAEKGYYVFPVAVIDTFMKENGLPNPAEMNSVPLDKLRENIGADSVLYVRIKEWGQKFHVISSDTIIRAHMRLVDARTGQQLWDAEVYASQGSNGGNGGLLETLVEAVVTQVIASNTDKTQPLSSTANYQVIHNSDRGLLPGPYYPKDKK